MSREELDRICAEVLAEHLARQDRCNTIPLQPTGRRPKKRPRTAIISYAAQEQARFKD